MHSTTWDAVRVCSICPVGSLHRSGEVSVTAAARNSLELVASSQRGQTVSIETDIDQNVLILLTSAEERLSCITVSTIIKTSSLAFLPKGWLTFFRTTASIAQTPRTSMIPGIANLISTRLFSTNRLIEQLLRSP